MHANTSNLYHFRNVQTQATRSKHFFKMWRCPQKKISRHPRMSRADGIERLEKLTKILHKINSVAFIRKKKSIPIAKCQSVVERVLANSPESHQRKMYNDKKNQMLAEPNQGCISDILKMSPSEERHHRLTSKGPILRTLFTSKMLR